MSLIAAFFQDCPDTGDFRAQQCSEYDEVPFENVKYQ